MLRRLRRTLRRIDYYGATRTRTVWHRVFEIGAFAMFALCWVATFTADRAISRIDGVESIWIAVMANERGESEARLVDESRILELTVMSRVRTIFQLELATRDHGWPTTTTVEQGPPTLAAQANARARQRAVSPATPPADWPLVRERLDASGLGDRARAWEDRSVLRTRPLLSWLLGAGAWFVMLVIVWRLLVPVIRIGTRVGVAAATGRRRSRARRGHCPVCGYDLRGLEFSPHCPECGTLQV